jgi:hypothetical protein
MGHSDPFLDDEKVVMPIPNAAVGTIQACIVNCRDALKPGVTTRARPQKIPERLSSAPVIVGLEILDGATT